MELFRFRNDYRIDHVNHTVVGHYIRGYHFGFVYMDSLDTFILKEEPEAVFTMPDFTSFAITLPGLRDT